MPALTGALAWLRPLAASAAPPPPLMLAAQYHEGIRLDEYRVSEKYDGVRAYWDGSRLLTRGGEQIHAPVWFTAGWPSTAMDGELWAGRGRFEQTVSAVRKQQPLDAQWQHIRFMLFDLPQEPGDFDRRLVRLQWISDTLRQHWVVPVKQRRLASHAALLAWLEEVEAAGGEGLMLHRGASLYRAGRSDDLLKLKSMEDAEATVIAYVPGKGKYTGMVGALEVETAQGIRFSLGSGLSDAQRRQPPPIGSLVTYRYRGRHPSGKPRFAVFLRQRLD